MGEIALPGGLSPAGRNIGLKTRDILNLVPGTEVTPRRSAGTTAFRRGEKRKPTTKSLKIARPVVRKVDAQAPDYFTSDRPTAGAQIASPRSMSTAALHLMSLLRLAYGPMSGRRIK